ncbi:PREDICTED: arp2/3 complex-activating protein rickA-like [Priapulus caudatus]|uniref:Arp2/3 complex-activating protein rickA-like n=1 Tax=Priapulus caudatus TaxID=37621 RepID=A0ABM1EHW0_PRICU|nr:PREDICTED: arp2/3 complex-activating protein rickA-like [Priapulus caudatus]
MLSISQVCHSVGSEFYSSLCGMPDGELDKIIKSLEFENQQHAKVIAKEEQNIIAIEGALEKKQMAFIDIQQEISEIDANTKRTYKQFTHNRDRIESLKNDTELLVRHEKTLIQQLEQMKQSSEQELIEQQKVVEHYTAVALDYEQKYQSSPFAQQLQKKVEAVTCVEEQVKCNEDHLNRVKTLIEALNLSDLPFKDMSNMIVKVAALRIDTVSIESAIWKQKSVCEATRFKIDNMMAKKNSDLQLLEQKQRRLQSVADQLKAEKENMQARIKEAENLAQSDKVVAQRELNAQAAESSNLGSGSLEDMQTSIQQMSSEMVPVSGSLMSKQCTSQGSTPRASILQLIVPQLGTQSSNIPQLNVLQPSIPEPSILQHNVPQPSTPRISIPQLNVPQRNTPRPSIPQINVPQPSTPEPGILQHNVSQPSTPRISIPQLNTPRPSIPQINVPQPSTPRPSIPQFNVPQSSTPRPSIPQFNVPQSSTPRPSIPQFNVPQPSIPQFNVPQLSTPQINVPQSSTCQSSTPQPNTQQLGHI